MFIPVFSLKNTYLFILVASLSLSCNTIKELPYQQLNQGACYLENRIPTTSSVNPTPLYELALYPTLDSLFSESSLNIANGIGALNLISEYVEFQNLNAHNHTLENRVKAIELFQEIEYKINLTSLEISSIASELDCEEERISQIADYMKEKENEVGNKLNVAAIVVGASGAIFSGVEMKGNADKIIGISAGIVEATLGALMLLNNKKINFLHERNALGEIWKGVETSKIFPSSVWYYLCYYNPEKKNQNSKKYEIIQRWLSFEQLEKAKTKKRNMLLELYFGGGGKYTTEQLYNRANMYDQLESYIKLMKQELSLLSIELNNIKIN